MSFDDILHVTGEVSLPFYEEKNVIQAGLRRGGLMSTCGSAHARNGLDRDNLGKPRPRKKQLYSQGVYRSVWFVLHEEIDSK